ncbi:MAG TPA: ATP-binding protein [Burkholderiaceae bacterium]|nr:ATP-binding protein [Burkholderiaceae bacterium]
MAGEPLYRFPAQMDALQEVLTQLEHLAGSFDSATVLRAQTVVEELFVNSVTHGGRENGAGVVVAFSVAACDGELRLHYEDQFAQFDPFQNLEAIEQKARQPVERRAVGGLGRLLAGRLADEVRYARQRGRNCIDLRFIPRLPRT